jgi:hypothetical protein
MRLLATALATALVATLASAPALAAPAYWTDWTSTSNVASAVIGDLTVGSTTVGVTYSGPYQFAQTSGGTNYWATNPVIYTSPSVDNGPTSADIIALNAGGTKTIRNPGPAGVPAGRHRGHGKPVAVRAFLQAVTEVMESLWPFIERTPALRRARPARPPGRTRARDHVPRVLGRRPRRGAGQPRLPHPAQHGHRPLQGRPALPPVGEPVDPEVPGLRADLQERADHAAHGRRQGRLGLRPQGQEPGRGDALLPGLRDRTVPPRRRRHRRAGRRHRRGRARGRLHGRHDEEAQPTAPTACSPARA